jgi:hypothetical protein
MLLAVIAIVNVVKTASTTTTINNGTANSGRNIIDASKENNNRIIKHNSKNTPLETVLGACSVCQCPHAADRGPLL